MSKPATAKKQRKRQTPKTPISVLPERPGPRKPSDVLWPSKGPGRKRIVTQGSLDELAACIAHRVAAACVEDIRAGCEQMARDMIARMLGER